MNSYELSGAKAQMREASALPASEYEESGIKTLFFKVNNDTFIIKKAPIGAI